MKRIEQLAVRILSLNDVEDAWNSFVDMHASLEVLSKSQPSFTRTVKDNAIPAFKAWLLQEGMDADQLDALEIKYGDFGLGLYTKTARAKNDLLFTIPLQCCITKQSILANEPFRTLIEGDSIIQSMPQLLHIVYLAYHMHHHLDEFAPYLHLLPNYISPVFSSPKDLVFLFSSPLTLLDAIKLAAAYVKQYHHIVEHYPDLNLSYKAFCWIVSVIQSRQNQIPLASNEPPSLALIPLWDCCNHKEAKKITTVQNVTKQRTECRSIEKLVEGQEIFIYYGKRGNRDLGLHMGFLSPVNRYNSTRISLRLASGPLSNRKLKLLVKSQYKLVQSFEIIQHQSPLDNIDLLTYLTITCANEDELKVLEAGDPVNPSPATIQTIFARIKEGCEQALQLMEASRKHIPGAASSPYQTLFLQIGDQEKAILTHCIKMCSQLAKDFAAGD